MQDDAHAVGQNNLIRATLACVCMRPQIQVESRIVPETKVERTHNVNDTAVSSDEATALHTPKG